MEVDDEVKLAKVFQPTCLSAVEDLHGGKVFVIGNNIDRMQSAIQIVLPDSERFVDSVEFLVVNIVVEFC